jgi:hypothetical protein
MITKAQVDEAEDAGGLFLLAQALIIERDKALALLRRINALELENWPTVKTPGYVDLRDGLTAETSAFLK